eukprot:snap_masked-scaffold_1-processed-gene-20.49-mRNA-1 protein AED:0.08 eAED:0.08 QI:0/0/0/1/1/1/2/0/333
MLERKVNRPSEEDPESTPMLLNTDKSNAKVDEPTISPLKALLACVFYMFTGPTLILNNKYIFSDLDFKYPILVSSLGMFMTSLATTLYIWTTKQSISPEYIDIWSYLRAFFPIGAALATTLASGNLVYLHLGVGMIQMLKAFSPVIVLIAKLESPSRGVVFSLLGIVFGTVLNCAGSTDFTILGLGLMFLSNFGEATRLVLSQFLLSKKKMGAVELNYFLCPVSFVCLMVAFYVFEFESLTSSNKIWVVLEGYNWINFVGASILGVFVNISSYLVVKFTNSVTLKILGTVRNAGLVLVQVIFANEVITGLQFVAYIITLVAFGFYNYFKMTGK